MSPPLDDLKRQFDVWSAGCFRSITNRHFYSFIKHFSQRTTTVTFLCLYTSIWIYFTLVVACRSPVNWFIMNNSSWINVSFSTEASCITEMSVLMACWKQNNFVDTLCSNEINSFYMCVEKAQVCPCSAEFSETCPCINCDSSSTEKLRMGMEKSVTVILE